MSKPAADAAETPRQAGVGACERCGSRDPLACGPVRQYPRGKFHSSCFDAERADELPRRRQG